MPSRYFSYVVARDFGFAPNPFNGICTLATCKQNIRKAAVVGDWVIGTGSARQQQQNHLIFAMKISNRISFNEYWEDPQFEVKKPVMNGSLKKMYGDNIYHYDGENWIQADSHHSFEDGSPNPNNVNRDTSVNIVLISTEFYYFGKQAILIPDGLIPHIVKKGPGHRCPDEEWANELITYLSSNYNFGFYADPIQFIQFERYDGKS